MKVPKPVQQPSGKWFVRLRLDGTAYSKTFDTEREAEIWATGMKAQYLSGQLREHRSAEKKTIRQLMQEYVRDVPLSDASRQTWHAAQDHFIQFMDRPYSEIRNWQKCVSIELCDTHPNTVALYWRHVCTALRFHGLDVPQVKITKLPAERKEYLTAEQIPVFCEAIRGHKHEAYFLMMLESMRVSEALGVTDADITKDGIHVRGTKTAAADRFIPWLIPRLKEVIHDRTPITAQQLNRRLAEVCEENGLPRLSCHGLRISFASLCWSKGIPDRICMKLAGWQSLQVMHKIYVRISDDDVAKYADILSDAFH